MRRLRQGSRAANSWKTSALTAIIWIGCDGKELSREEWRGLTKGMISEGAPVTDEEYSMILDYLTKNYGKRRSQET